MLSALSVFSICGPRKAGKRGKRWVAHPPTPTLKLRRRGLLKIDVLAYYICILKEKVNFVANNSQSLTDKKRKNLLMSR